MKFISLVFVASALVSCLKKTAQVNLPMVAPWLKEFSLKEQRSKRKLVLYGPDNLSVLVIENLGELNFDQAERTAKHRIKLKLRSFQSPKSPYSGAVSKQYGCDEDSKPKLVANKPFAYLVFWANQRLAMSDCSQAAKSYKTIQMFKYCQSKEKLYNLEFYTSGKEWDEKKVLKQLNDLKCSEN